MYSEDDGKSKSAMKEALRKRRLKLKSEDENEEGPEFKGLGLIQDQDLVTDKLKDELGWKL